jgi:hypothetical protein
MAAVEMIVGAFKYPFNHAYDVYSGAGYGAFGTPAIAIAPQATHGRKKVLVSVRL